MKRSFIIAALATCFAGGVLAQAKPGGIASAACIADVKKILADSDTIFATGMSQNTINASEAELYKSQRADRQTMLDQVIAGTLSMKCENLTRSVYALNKIAKQSAASNNSDKVHKVVIAQPVVVEGQPAMDPEISNCITGIHWVLEQATIAAKKGLEQEKMTLAEHDYHLGSLGDIDARLSSRRAANKLLLGDCRDIRYMANRESTAIGTLLKRSNEELIKVGAIKGGLRSK